jgi:hypothetical protein
LCIEGEAGTRICQYFELLGRGCKRVVLPE